MNERLQDVYREIFADDTLTVDESTAMKDLPDWDSFAQVRIILAVEEEFEVKFTTHEVVQMQSVGEIIAALARRSIPM